MCLSSEHFCSLYTHKHTYISAYNSLCSFSSFLSLCSAYFNKINTTFKLSQYVCLFVCVVFLIVFILYRRFIISLLLLCWFFFVATHYLPSPIQWLVHLHVDHTSQYSRLCKLRNRLWRHSFRHRIVYPADSLWRVR